VNHGGILRLAEAYRIEEVVFQREEDAVRDFSGAVGAAPWMPRRWGTVQEEIDRARADGYAVYGLTLDDRAIAHCRTDWRFPALLILGQEKYGLAPEIADQCDSTIAIPMYGLTQSLNVGQAAAIALDRMASALDPAEHPPARSASRILLGLPPADYRSFIPAEGCDEPEGSTESRS
jgi:tRNA G18 (ribose-2'-O)-methylase SpoU